MIWRDKTNPSECTWVYSFSNFSWIPLGHYGSFCSCGVYLFIYPQKPGAASGPTTPSFTAPSLREFVRQTFGGGFLPPPKSNKQGVRSEVSGGAGNMVFARCFQGGMSDLRLLTRPGGWEASRTMLITPPSSGIFPSIQLPHRKGLEKKQLWRSAGLKTSCFAVDGAKKSRFQEHKMQFMNKLCFFLWSDGEVAAGVPTFSEFSNKMMSFISSRNNFRACHTWSSTEENAHFPVKS